MAIEGWMIADFIDLFMAGSESCVLWLLSGVLVPSEQRWQSTQDILTWYLVAVDRPF